MQNDPKSHEPIRISADQASFPIGTKFAPAPARAPMRVVVLHKRNADPDEHLLHLLEGALTRQGHHLFLDKHTSIGMQWAKDVEYHIRTADAVIPLLSPSSMQNEMFAFEVEIAHAAAQNPNHRPHLIPVRVNEERALPEALSGILSHIPPLSWNGPEQDGRIVVELENALKKIAAVDPPVAPPILRISSAPIKISAHRSLQQPTHRLDALGGALPLDSTLYVARQADTEFNTAVMRKDSVILVKGARQMGKTSLLARGLQLARRGAARVVELDLQKLNASHFTSIESFFSIVAELIAAGLDLHAAQPTPADLHRSPNVTFERFLRREVLEKVNGQLVLGLDEIDRLFTSPFGAEVFSLFRSWHNERALDPSGPWSQLTLAIAYATEAHLFIHDLNQSPFNVGTRVTLDDFTRDQVSDLNRRYGSPLKSSAEVARLHRLVNGQPYLVCRGLQYLIEGKITIDELELTADRDEGLYGDHLRRILVLLARDPMLCEALREVLAEQACPNGESFFRLRSAGILRGVSQKDAQPRCQIYATYLAKHLL